MKVTVEKPPKVSLCRKCGGSGVISSGESTVCCPQCVGSGRVIVSGVMVMVVRPYRPSGKGSGTAAVQRTA